MDTVSKEKRSEMMSKIRSKHTKPELALRKIFRENGISYRLHYGKYNIDIALPSKKIAIFIDGCFWHSCPKHGHMPKSNKAFWRKKLKRNFERDKTRTKELKKIGWKVIRIWEHDIKK